MISVHCRDENAVCFTQFALSVNASRAISVTFLGKHFYQFVFVRHSKVLQAQGTKIPKKRVITFIKSKLSNLQRALNVNRDNIF